MQHNDDTLFNVLAHLATSLHNKNQYKNLFKRSYNNYIKSVLYYVLTYINLTCI